MKTYQKHGGYKSNIDFMNDLNKNMTFFQMPLKFSEGEGNGELYVFTNKKALTHNSEDVSAMLHLDMEHLGPIDVYVKLNKRMYQLISYLRVKNCSTLYIHI